MSPRRNPATTDVEFDLSTPIELTPGAAGVLLRILRKAHARQLDAQTCDQALAISPHAA